MKVSVIVPIYKVERFIVKCADSLLSQTLDDVEFIFINDASPDNSMKLLQACIEKYPQRKSCVKIIRHTENMGLPAARNSGLAVATGEYIFHCDSDDFVDKDMLEVLYQTAIKQRADIVWCDWYLSFEKNERYMRQPQYSTPMEALRGMLSGAMKFTVWNKLVKHSLYVDNHIEFPTGYGMGEDMTMMLLFSCAEKVYYLPRAFYHYVKLNMSAFTQTFSERHLIDLKYNVHRIETYMKAKYGTELEKEIAFLKLDVKFPLLISNSSDKYLIWKNLYPEADAYIGKNKLISKRATFIQWCAKRNLFCIVKLHYIFLQKIIYGMIYR